ncbi:MAG TPA: Ig-like domain-containing protein [Aeromicrobium sp.]|nr:Ig-like domain-containing protein [Aeromicrobium sp.]HKY57655.1 Ig-like domain-containing protein [Aeromicrobium sp.]
MSDLGAVSEVVEEPRGSFLTADAAVLDTELSVDDAGDFDDQGGVLELNGTRLAYLSVTMGETRDDPDVITLESGLSDAANVDDTVSVVIASEVAFDYYAWVDMDEGGSVPVPLRYDQLPGWPVGQYDPPIPVAVAEDLSGIEDAPGRPSPVPASETKFRNVDSFTVATVADQECVLTYLPVDGSEHVMWHPQAGGGLHVPAAAWSRASRLLTVPEFDGLAIDDVLTVEYAYRAVQGGIEPPSITDPDDGETVSDTTPTITGTGEPGYTVVVEVDGDLVNTVTVDSDGEWTVTVGSALDPGNHTITATQTGPGGYEASATSMFATPSPVGATVAFREDRTGGSNGATALNGMALPTGTQVGDLIIVAFYGIATANLVMSDPRLEEVGPNTYIGWATDLSDLAVSANTGRWSLSCMTVETDAVGWTVQSVTDTSLGSSDTMDLPVISNVAAAVFTGVSRHNVVAGSLTKPAGYTAGEAIDNTRFYHSRVDLWSNGGVLGSSPANTTTMAGGGGEGRITVIGLIGP